MAASVRKRRAADPQMIDEAPPETGQQPFRQQIGFEGPRHRHRHEHRIQRGDEQCACDTDHEQPSLVLARGRRRRAGTPASTHREVIDGSESNRNRERHDRDNQWTGAAGERG
jgi:hypothetical protein